MDERMKYAPCGYFSMSGSGEILEVNDTLLSWLEANTDSVRGILFESLLSRSSRVFFQIYYTPLIKLNGKVEEMYVTLRSMNEKDVPVLLSAVIRERDGKPVTDGVLTLLRRQSEYETQVAASSKAAERAREELRMIREKLSSTKKELEELKTQWNTHQSSKPLNHKELR
ncbi:serine/threonine protein phosphatase [Paenibacillus gansuensis]|uniref:Serine/threonine protein phosphatase n=1 Tax=Paenibacillus gansuensis TaxID=306542 RepID=A0ABW5PI62_9BACL